MFNFFNKDSRTANKNGKIGEQTVSSVLFQLPPYYKTFNNVLLKTGGGTTQIDHVVVSPFGIFCIETKSHKGLIFGDMTSRNWTQVLYKRPYYKFYSPFLQNNGHIKNLCKTLNLDDYYFSNIICFSSPYANLSNVNCDCACYVSTLYFMITSYRKRILSDSDMMVICNMLSKSNIQSSYQDRKHVNYVKNLRRY